MSSQSLDLLGTFYWLLVIPTLIWLIIPRFIALGRFLERGRVNVQSSPRPTLSARALKALIKLIKWSLGLALFWALLMSYPVRLVTWIAGQQHGGLYSNRTDPSVKGYMETAECLTCWEQLVVLDEPGARFKSRALDFIEFTVPHRIQSNFALDLFNIGASGERAVRIDPKDWNTFVPSADQRGRYPQEAKRLGYDYEGIGIYRIQLERLPYEECGILQSNVWRTRYARNQLPSTLEADLAMLRTTTTDSSYTKVAELVKRGQCPVARRVDKPQSRYVDGGYNERVLYEDGFHRVYRFEFTKGVDLQTGQALYHSVQYCVTGTLIMIGGIAPTYCFRADPQPGTPLETDISYPGNLFGLWFEVKE